MELQKSTDAEETLVLYLQALGRARLSMLIGFIICLIGVVVSFVTYETASDGGYYLVMYGAILFGGIKGIKGAWSYWKLKRMIS